jgi:hypothetical protein
MLSIFARLLAGSIWLICAHAAANGDERRVALVVGVAEYKHAPRLANTANDAKAISSALEQVGFQVEILQDPDRAALETAIRRFGQRAQGADASLFYYAGHALEVSGRNWLLPAPADIQTAYDLRFEAFDLDSIIEQVSGRSRVSLFFLDACRDNPFRARLSTGTRELVSRGLGRADATAGTLIAFAAAPGRVALDGTGSNSPFTAALVSQLQRSGVELRRILAEVRRQVREATDGKQLPWENSALEGDFFFRPPAPPAAALQPATLPLPQAGPALQPATPTAPSTTPASPSGSPASAPATPAAAASSDASPFRLSLLTALAAASAQHRDEQSNAYEKGRAHKAMAILPDGSVSWRRIAQESALFAEISTLEACQLRHGKACALAAVNETVLQKAADGKWPTRDMPRLRYAGYFDPTRIPIVPASVRDRPDIRGYASAAAPKAIALHPWGRPFIVTGAVNQAAAEQQALDACNSDPQRAGKDGSCFLYAAGNFVILRLRLTAPRPPASTIAQALAYVGNTASEPAFVKSSLHRALAVHPATGRSFRWDGAESSETAERYALAGCQLLYNEPCILLASDYQLRAPDPLAAAAQDQVSLRYSGPYSFDKLPFVTIQGRRILEGYPKLKSPKAVAIRPTGARFITASGSSIADAEAKALAACNDADASTPCLLYAVNDRVVLPQRRTEASR